MKKRLEALKRDRSGGFTLVELIVVLIILAILAALLLPTLTGYIDKAREKQIIAETRSCVMAAQTLADEAYAGVKITSDSNIPDEFNETDIKTLAEVEGSVKAAYYTTASGKVSYLQYQEEGTGGKYCVYEDGEYTISATTPTAHTKADTETGFSST